MLETIGVIVYEIKPRPIRFTAEPLKESLDFWMQELDLPFDVEFAPYNQVFNG